MKSAYFQILLLGFSLAQASSALADSEEWDRYEPRTKAESCPSVDARAARPELAEHYARPRDQDGLGWCYAFASSDVLSQHLGVPVSAVDLSYTYNYEVENSTISRFFRRLFMDKDEVYDGGIPSNMLDYAKERGVCPEKVLPSESYLVSQNSWELKKAIRILQELRDKIRTEKMSPKEFVDCASCRAHIASQDFQGLFPGATAESIYTAVSKNMEKEINTSLFNFAQSQCEGKRISLPGSLKSRSSTAPAYQGHKLFPEIDKQLGKGELVVISVDLKMLTTDMRGSHALVAVGRAFRNGQCKYLLRNSWGRGCAAYKGIPELREDCDAEAGTVWVSETRMNDYMRTIDYVE